MAGSLILMVVLFALNCAIGFGLGSNHANGWSVMLLTAVSIVALQLSYLASALIAVR